jgi:ketosteroid isomerase-like protein
LQSDETLRKLGGLDRDLVQQRIQALIAKRTAGDMGKVLELVAEDVQFSVKGHWAAFPYAGPARGKKMVTEAMAAITVQYEHCGSAVHEMIIDGDRVAVRRTAKIRHRGTGKVGNIEIADFIRFRDGLLLEWTEVVDSMALAQLEES